MKPHITLQSRNVHINRLYVATVYPSRADRSACYKTTWPEYGVRAVLGCLTDRWGKLFKSKPQTTATTDGGDHV